MRPLLKPSFILILPFILVFIVHCHTAHGADNLPRRFSIEAPSIIYNPQTATLTATKPKFTFKDDWQLKLHGQRLECHPDGCIFYDATFFPCEHCPRRFRLTASQIKVDQSTNIYLTHPVFWLHHVPVFYLPKLKLKPSSEPGFLPPTMFWSQASGLVVGPAIWLPLVPKRTLILRPSITSERSSQTAAKLQTPLGNYNAVHKYHHNQHQLWVTGRSGMDLSHSRVDAAVDAGTHRSVRGQLNPLKPAAPFSHSASRLQVTHGTQQYNAAANFLRLQVTPLATHAFTGTVILYPLINKSAIQPSLTLQLHHVERLEAHQTTVRATPQISISTQWGPFIYSGAIYSELAQHSSTHYGDRSRQTIESNNYLELPLIKQLGSILHVLSFFGAHNMSNILAPPNDAQSVTSMQFHQRLSLGVQNTFLKDYLRPLVSISGQYHFAPNAHNADRHYLEWNMRTESVPIRFSIDAQWRISSNALTMMQSGLHTETQTPLNFEIQMGYYTGYYHYYLPTRVMKNEASRYTDDASGTDSPRLIWQHTIRLSLGQFVTYRTGIQTTLIPQPKPHSLFYQLEYGGRCNCVRLGIAARHIDFNTLPTVMFYLNLSGM